jgi:hypothetical protein
VNSTLLRNVYTGLKSSLSGFTTHVYYLYLPSQELLTEFTVTYEMNNVANEDTFDSKEAVKTYSLIIKSNSPTANSFGDSSIYIKNAIYSLTNSGVNCIKLVSEEVFYDSELNVFTEYLNFELQVS